jgi:hypothetical protein
MASYLLVTYQADLSVDFGGATLLGKWDRLAGTCLTAAAFRRKCCFHRGDTTVLSLAACLSNSTSHG